MPTFLVRCLVFLKRERLSFSIFAIGMSLNMLAWIIPFGRLRYPAKDPTGLITFVGQHIQSADQLRYFWSGMTSLTIMTLLLSLYEVWQQLEGKRS